MPPTGIGRLALVVSLLCRSHLEECVVWSLCVILSLKWTTLLMIVTASCL